MTVHVGPPRIISHFDNQILVCDSDGAIQRHDQLGYFVADTRFVSSYSIRLGGQKLQLLNSNTVSHFGARFEFANSPLNSNNRTVSEQTLHLRLDRSVGDGIHEDYDLTNYSSEPVRVQLEILIESDFADLMDVKSRQLVQRGIIQSSWEIAKRCLTTTYINGDFTRSLIVRAERCDSEPQHANGRLSFNIELEANATWHTCIFWLAHLGSYNCPNVPLRYCHQLCNADAEPDKRFDAFIRNSTNFETDNLLVDAAISRAISDLGSLRLLTQDQHLGKGDASLCGWIPAAGVPWFVAPFGRDTLIMSLQTMLLTTGIAIGSLKKFGQLQGVKDDPHHDEQPGKIVHELRSGELAHFGLIPQTPYFGAADAPALYVQVAAELWRWTGSVAAMRELAPYVDRALFWIDNSGDLDGDGLQEYQTRAGEWGYYNQSWKDSGESMVHANGTCASLPLAPCELQGYVVAAKRGWADVCEQAFNDDGRASRLRREADELVERIEDRYWWDTESTYYLALDGDKRPLQSVTSNPGHLLWSGAIASDRAKQVADRLFADDMWSGWGVRTLSSDHYAYNPFSYQRGSVWPHDNALLVAGLHRYGLHKQAHEISLALFEAAGFFADHRLPELFAGLRRDSDSFPIQYLGANVPQGWSSGAIINLITSMLGPEPNAINHRLILRPHLPDWLDHVRVSGLRVASASTDISITRMSERSDIHIERIDGTLDVISDF